MGPCKRTLNSSFMLVSVRSNSFFHRQQAVEVLRVVVVLVPNDLVFERCVIGVEGEVVVASLFAVTLLAMTS